MISIKEFVAPKSVDEAYEYLINNKRATIIGGGAFIRMGNKNIPLAIDLSKCNLNYIKEDKDCIEIGAMTTFGDIEGYEILDEYFDNILKESVKDIVGVQLRNIVTVGGTVYSRYGFSDFITALLVLNTKVKLYKGGIIPLEEFLNKGASQPDLLESIIIMKDKSNAVFKSMRNSRGDYAILNLAISVEEQNYKIAVGARPSRAILAIKTMEHLKGKKLCKENIKEACNILEKEITFGSNRRGSKEYRREISKVLLKRALLEVVYYED